MSLYIFPFFKSSSDDWYLEDESGKQLPALIVFSESLKYLKQSLLEEAKKQQTDIGVYDIKWILTVPAIWSDPANRSCVELQSGYMKHLLNSFKRRKKEEKNERKKERKIL